MDNKNSELPWTGERYLPEIRGDIALEHIHRYAFAAEFVEGKRVLDIASGEGYGSQLLARKAAAVIGVDIDPLAIQHAQDKYKTNNLLFKQGSCEQIPLPNHSVDIVISFETIEHLADHEKMLAEIKRVLTPEGILIVSTPDKQQYTDIPGHHNHFHLKELYRYEFEKLLSHSFKNQKILGQRILYGSHILETEQATQFGGIYEFQKVLTSEKESKKPLAPLYLIAICSDSELPKGHSTICEQPFYEAEAYQSISSQLADKENLCRQQEQALQQSHNALQKKDILLGEKENLINRKNNFIREQQKHFQKRNEELLQQEELIKKQKLLISEKANQVQSQAAILSRKEALLDEKEQVIAEQKRQHLLDEKKNQEHFESRDLVFSIENRKFLRLVIKILISITDIRTHFKRNIIASLIRKSPLFDSEWYLKEYPDVKDAGIDPVLHYIHAGASEERDPGPFFHTKQYLEQNRDIAKTKINPLYHHTIKQRKERVANKISNIPSLLSKLKRGENIKRATRNKIKAFCQKKVLEGIINKHLKVVNAIKKEELFSEKPTPADQEKKIIKDVQLIAIYLPQYHNIQENNTWWGEGFTEWTNVRRGVPFYKGHYQPHIPHDDIGYYDLEDESVLEKQAKLAQEYGIHGFCFYYYWFGGKRLLEKPINRLLESGKPDFPFCFCWANENWTRTWDGGDHQILIGQEHSLENDEAIIRDLIPALKDSRYIRIDGKPLIVVYRPALLPDMKKTAEKWRIICREEGVGEIYLTGMRSFEFINPFLYGLDAAIQFPPLNVPSPNLASCSQLEVQKTFSGNIFSMEQVIDYYAQEEGEFPLIRSVCPSWDNTARRMERGTSWIGATPKAYYQWLCQAINKTRNSFEKGKRIVFINAWNEWGEGCHLEPDQKFGYAWLNATKAAISTISEQFSECQKNQNRHYVIYKDRREKIEEIFSSLIDWSRFDYLVNYPQLFSLVTNQKNASFLLRNDVPTVQVDERLISLPESSSLKNIHFLISPPNNVICFVILQYNQVEATGECVQALRRLDFQGRKKHIIIVDNKSQDKAIDQTKKLFGTDEDITLLFNDANYGFAKGNNRGYVFAKKEFNPEFIIILNNDVIINDSAFVKKLIELYNQYSYSLLGPDIIIPDGRHESPINDYIYALNEWYDITQLYKKQKSEFLKSGIAQFKKVGKASPDKEIIINPILQGAAYILSPIFIQNENLIFNESTFLYGEELLLATHCLFKGHLMLYSSTLSVMHKEGVSTKALAETEKYIYGYDNAILATTLCCSWLESYLKAKKGEWLSFQEAKKEKFFKCLKQYQKNILYDLLFSQPGFHGGGEYGKILFKKTVLECQKRGDVKLWAALNQNLYIDPWVLELCKKYAINLIQVESFKDIAELVNMDRFSLFFAPAIVVYAGYEYMKKVGTKLLFSNQKTKVIGCLHDIRDFELANDFEKICSLHKEIGCVKENSLTPKELNHEINLQKEYAEKLKVMYQKICEADSIHQLITVSEYSLKSILKSIGKFKNIPQVLFPPIKNRATPKFLNNMELQKIDYILVVNAGRFEKNASLAVKAFDDLCSDVQFSSLMGDLKMFLSGIHRLEDLKLKKIKNPNRFIVTETLLPEHYEFVLKHARFLIYPTFNEGFGLPPVEAMTYGIPSIVSKVASIPEVCGKAVMYCDPYHLDSLKEAILEMMIAPISKEKIKTQYNTIIERQKRDVDCLVNLICSC